MISVFHPRREVVDLATPYLRGEAELRGEGRGGLEPVRRRVSPTRREGAALRVGVAEDD